jgi:rubredoxin
MSAQLVDPQGRPLSSPKAPKPSTACPMCGAGKDKRINTAGFGPPQMHCGGCGYHFEGAKA